MISEYVREHYLRQWGQPSRVMAFSRRELTIEVYKWNADANPEEVDLYATLGCCDYALPGFDPTHRLEFFIGLLPGRDEVANPLARLAGEPIVSGTPLDDRHSVTFLEPLWPGTGMRTLLVRQPVEDIIPPLHVPKSDGIHVEFLSAQPLYDSEVAFKARYGVDALDQYWEKRVVPFWDPDRPPEPT